MCSLRSWPTQNARPVPVSTTHRTVSSPDTRCRAASNASLVATSRLFIASGRLRVTVAMPWATSTRTGAGESVMVGRVSHPQAPDHEAVGGRLEAVGLAGEQLRRRYAGPVAR